MLKNRRAERPLAHHFHPVPSTGPGEWCAMHKKHVQGRGLSVGSVCRAHTEPHTATFTQGHKLACVPRSKCPPPPPGQPSVLVFLATLPK